MHWTDKREVSTMVVKKPDITKYAAIGVVVGLVLGAIMRGER